LKFAAAGGGVDKLNIEHSTFSFRHTMRAFHRRFIGHSMFNVRCSMFSFFLFLMATSVAFGQSQTNALPNLLPPLAPMQPTFWEQHGIAVLVGSLILAVLVAVGVWRVFNPGPQPVLPPIIVAGKALAKCGARPEDGKVLSEVSQVLRHYISAVFGFSPGELTTAELCRELGRSEKLTPQLTRKISDFLRACDERKFSSSVSSEPLNAAARALQFVVVIDEEARRQDDARATRNERRV
jgi:hypothetical protein